ncbi:MAG: hypothetical protein AABX05_03180 [Nanoarchaeota archaeon]
MKPIIPPFNPKRIKELFHHYPANHQLPRSIAGIVEDNGLFQVQMRYGLYDQLPAFYLADLFKKTEGRFLKPDEKEFQEVCDLMLQLRWPRVYRKEYLGAIQGYVAGEEELFSILEAARQDQFRDLYLANFEIRYGIDNRILYINGLDSVFRLDKKNQWGFTHH